MTNNLDNFQESILDPTSATRALLDVSAEAIFLFDTEGVIRYVNPALQRVCRVQEEIVGQSLTSLRAQGLLSTPNTELVLRNRKSITLMHRFGEARIMVTGSPIYDDSGNLLGVFNSGREPAMLKDQLARCEEATEFQNYFRDDSSAKLVSQELEVIPANGKMRNILRLAHSVASYHSTVLITGESGVGKGVIAEQIHARSSRSGRPFVQVNCGAIPDSLFESEFFGYERGAFTGASPGGKQGLFELANGGTLFLDEVAELPIPMQVKLLKVLEDMKVTRVGGTKSVKVDVRILAATNKNLLELIRNRKFREDLYYRICVVAIDVPPLRERQEDIPFLAQHMLQRLNDSNGFTKSFHPQVVERFQRYDWPGNVRELQNVVERLYVFSNSSTITLEVADLPISALVDGPLPDIVVHKLMPLKTALAMVEQQLLVKALQEYGSTRGAARALEVDQSTVVRKCRRQRENQVT